jgi:hypothetical protein
MYGSTGKSLEQSGKASDFYDLKGYVGQVIRRTGIDPDRCIMKR